VSAADYKQFGNYDIHYLGESLDDHDKEVSFVLIYWSTRFDGLQQIYRISKNKAY